MSVAAAASSHSPRNKRENVCDQQQQASTAHGTNVRMSVDSEVERVSGRSPQTQQSLRRDLQAHFKWLRRDLQALPRGCSPPRRSRPPPLPGFLRGVFRHTPPAGMDLLPGVGIVNRILPIRPSLAPVVPTGQSTIFAPTRVPCVHSVVVVNQHPRLDSA